MAGLDKSPSFFEADGALRAYANRMAIVAISEAVIILILGIIVAMTKVRPPTIIRVAANGEVTVVSADSTKEAKQGSVTVTPATSAAEEPVSIEKENYVRNFVNEYMGYNEHTVSENWAAAVSMMTQNLKQDVLKKMSEDNTVSQIQDSHTNSDVKISKVTQDSADPLSFTVYATRKVSHLVERREVFQKLSEAYTVRLVEGPRSVVDPSGLMVAEFHSEQISADNAAPQQ